MKNKKSLIVKACSLLMAYGAVVMLGLPTSLLLIGEPELPTQLNRENNC